MLGLGCCASSDARRVDLDLHDPPCDPRHPDLAVSGDMVTWPVQVLEHGHLERSTEREVSSQKRCAFGLVVHPGHYAAPSLAFSELFRTRKTGSRLQGIESAECTLMRCA